MAGSVPAQQGLDANQTVVADRDLWLVDETEVPLGERAPQDRFKIQALTAMANSHQDPGELSTQVDAVAEGLNQTEETIRDLQSITGLSHDANEAPSILGNELEVQ